MKSIFLTIAALILSLACNQAWAEDFYVSAPKGSDANTGTSLDKPVATLNHALRLAREYRRLNGSEEDINILLCDNGTITLSAPVDLRPSDSGTPEHPLHIRGLNGCPTLSGGLSLPIWHSEGKLLVTTVPEWNGYPVDFRQLYIDGQKAIRARDIPTAAADGSDDPFEQMARIRCLDKENRILYVPATPALRTIARQGVDHAEMVLHEMWCVSNLRIESVEIQGDSAAIRFHEPESTIQWEHPWPFPMTGEHASPFYLTNHRTLLDEPGEWYYDLRSSKLYYWPKSQEERRLLMQQKGVATIPVLENLVVIEGTPEAPAHDVVIESVRFSESTWMRPSREGHVPIQAGMYLTEAYKLRPQMIRPDRNHKLDNQGYVGRPGAAVRVRCARNITFRDCDYCNLASSGIDLEEYIQDCLITNCHFHDIGGSAIVAGSFGPTAHEIHLPYRTEDLRQRCDGLVLTDNLIENVGLEDWGTLGIACGYVSNVSIAYNTIHDVPYSGISLGWGWTQSLNSMEGNEVYRNRITHYAKHNYDVAGIYTLGAQPKTYIYENVVDSICTPSYVHDPHHWFYLYCDEGSAFITMRDNWCPAEKFLRNANGPCNTWENNGPQVNDSIKQNAGRRQK